nr:MAG TPA: hypothetical protein [Caudoviricetes sp.]
MQMHSSSKSSLANALPNRLINSVCFVSHPFIHFSVSSNRRSFECACLTCCVMARHLFFCILIVLPRF